jgi:ATP-dependent RNA helicase DDX5/DBP2
VALLIIARRLVQHLEKISSEAAKVLIFVGTKRTADELTKYLRQDGWPALAIHGDKQQQERDWVLNEFKSGRSPIMIATDVASRGLGTHISFVSPHPPRSSLPRDASTLHDTSCYMADMP